MANRIKPSCCCESSNRCSPTPRSVTLASRRPSKPGPRFPFHSTTAELRRIARLLSSIRPWARANSSRCSSSCSRVRAGATLRYLRIARNNQKISDAAFKLQVITTVTQITNMDWDLVSAYESGLDPENRRISRKAANNALLPRSRSPVFTPARASLGWTILRRIPPRPHRPASPARSPTRFIAALLMTTSA